MSSVTAGWMTGLPFWSVVWKTLSAFSTAGQTSAIRPCSRSVAVRGRPARYSAGRQLEEDVDDARLGDPHGVGKRARLADDAAVVVELEPGRALERDRAGARPRADQDGHAVGQVRPGRGGQRLGAVRRTDDDHELGTGQGLGDIVPRVPDRSEALEIAGRR